MLSEFLEADSHTVTRRTAAESSTHCPWCGDGGKGPESDRFRLYVNEDRYWCRQCGKSGDAIQFLIDSRKMTFPEAAAMVGKTLSPLTGKSRSSTPRKATSAPTEPAKVQPPQWRERAAAGIQRAHDNLMKNPEALNWLRLERGITRETAERFKLGWLEKNHFFQKSEFGLPADGKKLVVPSGLIIPWQDKRIRVRRSNDEEAEKYGRYYVLPGSDSEPMTIGTPSDTTAIIVESELDAILLAQEIRRPVFIVALGSAQVKPGPELLERLAECPAILVALDNDAAGAKASPWWAENVPGARRTLTPSRYGKDFGEAFLNGLDLNAWLSAAMTIYAPTTTTETADEVTFPPFTEKLF